MADAASDGQQYQQVEPGPGRPASRCAARSTSRSACKRACLLAGTNPQAPQVETPAPVVVAAPAQPAKAATPPVTEAEFEFSDTSAMTCLLCARQFKSLDQLKRHNKESDLHKVPQRM